MTSPRKRSSLSTLRCPQMIAIPDKLGEYLARDVQLVRDLGWEDFVRDRIGQGHFSDLEGVNQLSRCLLRQYWHRGDPVVLSGQRWTEGQWRVALDRGPHKYTMDHFPPPLFMVGKGQWVVLSYLVTKEIPGLRQRPPVAKEERDRQPQWIGDYSSSNLHYENLTISAMYAMKYGWYLESLIREVVISNPVLGPVHVLKADVSDGFYPIGLQPTNAPNMGIVFYLIRRERVVHINTANPPYGV